MLAKKSFSILITILLLAAAVLFVPSVKVLQLVNRKNPSEKFYSRQGYKNGFVISYTHSVNKGRVHDYYFCEKNNTLILDSTHFVSYGAGIPEPDETPGAGFEVLENGYIIKNLNRRVPRLVMAVGIIANHSFAVSSVEKNDYPMTDSAGHGKISYGIIENEEFLTDYFLPQTSLILEVKRVSPAGYIFHKFKKDSLF